MNNELLPEQWLDEQQIGNRQLVLVANPMADPNPIPTLFANGHIRDYTRLYQGTPFESLAALGPWLVRMDAQAMPALNMLLRTPEQHWGWVASAEALDMAELAAHWRARMVGHDGGQRFFYRFQDNRVIARHLQALDPEQIPLLLGPLESVLCWDGMRWTVAHNSQPGRYPEPFDTPWLATPPEQHTAAAEHRAHLQTWLWENHLSATLQLVNREPLIPWLDRQLSRAREWKWFSADQLHFLLEHQLCEELAGHCAWAPKANERPADHFARVAQELPACAKG